tara:strand:- start:1885 stop:2055 length:171 start_codon:yes stop_codon:yes gene_type:complete
MSGLQDKREAEIEEVKEWVAMIGACKELVQYQCIGARAAKIRELLEQLLPPLTKND